MNMFQRGNSGGPTAPPPGDEQEQPQPKWPKLATWEIKYWESGTDEVKTEVVTGHGMTIGNEGSLTIQTFYMDPAFGPTPRPTWGRSSYISFKDITPAQEPSRILH